MTEKRELVDASSYIGFRYTELGDLLTNAQVPFEVGRKYQDIREALTQLRRMIEAIVEPQGGELTEEEDVRTRGMEFIRSLPEGWIVTLTSPDGRRFEEINPPEGVPE